MPGWGAGSFENEDAQKFLRRLNSVGVGDLRQMLGSAAARDYLEAPVSGAVVAAAEVVAALVASASSVVRESAAARVMPQQISDWISKNTSAAPPDLAELARRAVEKVRTSSELKDLWLEAEGLNEWSAGLRDLEGRLCGHSD